MFRTKEILIRLFGEKSFLLSLLVFSLLSFGAEAKDRDVVSVSPVQVFHTKGGDPATGGGGNPLATTVFDSLVSMSPEQKIMPGLAESWKISPDWNHIDFYLREDVKFHNGDPFTAEDVKFSLETHLRRELRWHMRPLFQRNIKDIEIINPFQVRVYLNSPWPWIFTNLWLQTAMLPRKYREAVGDESFAVKPIGTGPFTWEEYQQDVYYKLRAVKHHFRQAPKIDSLTIRFVPDAGTRLAMLRAGEADIVEIENTHIPVVKSDTNLNLQMIKYSMGLGMWYCDLMSPDEPSPFHDLRVRQAASLAIDRETICQKIFFGGAEPMRDFISPLTLGYDPGVPADTYDPKKARELLAEAGYARGFKTTIYTLPRTRLGAETLSASLHDVGINAGLEVIEMGSLLSRFRAGTLTGLYFPGLIWWNPDPHPSKDGTNFWIRGQTWCYNSTPEIEAAVQKALHAFSEEEIAQYGREMADLIRESRLMMPLFAIHNHYGLSRKIKKWEPVMGVPMGTRYEYLELNP